MDNPKVQLADKLKAANYVLVTVSHNPSIDQLAALIGLALTLNKAGKHTAAVFSGQVPSTLDFLKPEDTIEKTTDSLRDFIIALDKSKADKLRYKVEDDVVRIFITPYKVSISQDDLEFSQGDFNVDVVVALGVTNQEDLDEAIITHGRILHDATVATINISREGDLGSIHWQDSQASSLSEMMTELAQLLGTDLIDNQIATALLTGIVAETERFSNEKTTAKVMKASATLMAAGANQQLVASELTKTLEAVDDKQELPPEEPGQSIGSDDIAEEPASSPGETEAPEQDNERALEISHDDEKPEADFHLPKVADDVPDEPSGPPEMPDIVPTDPEPEQPVEAAVSTPDNPPIEHLSRGSKLITEPPTLGGQLTANSQIAPLEPSTDSLSGGGLPQVADTLLSRETSPHVSPPETSSAQTSDPANEPNPPQPPAGSSQPVTGLTPPPPAWVPPQAETLAAPAIAASDEPTDQTLADLETTIHETTSPTGLDAARDEVMRALNSDTTQVPEPIQALNAQPMLADLNAESTPEVAVSETPMPTQPLNELPAAIPALPLPDASVLPPQPFDQASFGITAQPGGSVVGAPTITDPTAAPPVPPPIPFNFGAPPPPPQP